MQQVSGHAGAGLTPPPATQTINGPQQQPNATTFVFRKAVKQNAKLRLAVSGPGGSGKTYTLLKLATALGGRIAAIDTEHGSMEKIRRPVRLRRAAPGELQPRNLPAPDRRSGGPGILHPDYRFLVALLDGGGRGTGPGGRHHRPLQKQQFLRGLAPRLPHAQPDDRGHAGPRRSTSW